MIFSSHLSEEENQRFTNHVLETIGIDNVNVVGYVNHNQFSLPEVYNRAMREYNGDNIIMVFCHNDIIFRTKNWGKLLLNKFNNTNYSILGVAGTTYLSNNGIWWDDRTKMHGVVEHTDGYNTWVNEYSKPRAGYIKPVVLVDGLFIAVDGKKVYHLWDEEFKGFHLYDLSFCIPNYLDGCEIGVTTDIRILHKSVGMVNEQWDVNRKQFIEKYREELPIEYSDLE